VSVFLLDTTEIIQFLRGSREKKELFETLINRGDILSCCAISVSETYYGMNESERTLTDAFFEGLLYFPVTIDEAKLAGQWRKDYRQKGLTLTLNDTLIAAVCFYEKAVLITGNRKHFPMKEITVMEP
jgi:predicted nucleic acid-binding protein